MSMPRLEAGRTLRFLRLGSLIVPTVLALLFALFSWRAAEHGAMARAQVNARLISEFAYRQALVQQKLIAGADLLLSNYYPEGGLDQRARNFLTGLQESSNQGFGIGLFTPSGETVIVSADWPVPGDGGTHEYDALSKDTTAEGLFFDRVHLQPGAVDAVIVAARRNAPPMGVWVSALQVDTLRSFLQSIATNPGDAASLYRPDGKVIMRNLPMPEAIMLSPDNPGVRIAQTAERGTYEVVAQADGVRRFYAVERVADLGLFAAFGVGVETVRAAWLQRVSFVSALLGAAAVAGYATARYAERAMRAESGRAAAEFDRALLAEAENTAKMRQMMLQELNHRIKNSLQMIASMLRLQKARPEGPDLDEVTTRVMAIARIHDLLHRSADSFNVDFSALLDAIARSEAIVPPERRVAIASDCERLTIESGLATPLALCAAELVTNAVKHAFGPEGGRIEIVLRRDGSVGQLVVADDGGGLPEAPTRSSGVRVVDALVRQVRGEIAVETGPDGTRYTVTFPLKLEEDGEDAA
jgi:two-component sensor histidine kinase